MASALSSRRAPRPRLRQARRRAGLTQRELVARTGVPQSTIGRIESGRSDPRVSTLDLLLRACGDELDAVPRRGVGEDRTLPRGLLRLTPDERIDGMAHAAEELADMRATARVVAAS